jgi:hypothetical protein
MPEPKNHVSNRNLRTPRAAAIAGIIFALLFGASYTLIQLSVPALSVAQANWIEDQADTLTLGLSFLPFAGIAFLWFLGVIRDRMGYLEDQFFSTLFLGSGLLYIGLTLTAAAIAGGTLAVYALDPDILINSEGILLTRAIINQIMVVYAIRMAGMFMIVLGTIWVRTQVMPRWLAIITYLLALILIISIGFTQWVTMIFPTWVLLISIYILYLNYLSGTEQTSSDGLTVEQ